MKVLSVAEKPSVAKELAKILAGGENNYQKRPGQSQYNYLYEIGNCPFRSQRVNMVVTSVTGHLMEIEFEGDYKSWTSCRPVDLFEAPIRRTVKKENEKIESTLVEQARRCQSLLLWLDCDVEGENIAFEVIEVCKKANPRIEIFRARFSALIERDILRTVNNPDRPNQFFSDSVDARQEIDLRLGAAFTRFQTLRLQNRYESLRETLISYGPCQFPTLGFVVDRHLKIEAFKPESYWHINCTYECDDSDERLGKLSCNFSWSRGHIFDRYACLVLYDICMEQGGYATVKSVDSRPTTRQRPVPLNTVELQKLSSIFLRMSSDRTMAIAEALYQRGILSYPRTETDFFKEGFDIRGLIEEQTSHSVWGEYARGLLELDKYCPPRNGGHDDQAHPPIHPTKKVELNELNDDERQIYELVTRHFLACCSYDGKGNLTNITVKIPDTDYGEVFTATGLMVLERNWLDVYTYEKWTGNKVPLLAVGDRFLPKTLIMTSGITCPPLPISESDLIAEMDRNGIGTDATIAEHIKTIQKREYVIKDVNNRFIPTKLGLALVEAYNSMGYQLTKPYLRASMEADCRKIARGELRKEDVIRACLQKMKECFLTVNREVNKLDAAVSKYFNVVGSDQNDVQYQVLQRNFSICGVCMSHMDLKVQANRGSNVENQRRLLHCNQCQQSHVIPSRGDLRPQDIYCEICGFQTIVVLNRENQKEHSICPHCFKNPPGPPDSEEGLPEFRCFGCARSTCPLSGRSEGNDVDISPCPDSTCTGKMRLNKVTTGFIVSCIRQGCKSSWWLPKRGVTSVIPKKQESCPRCMMRTGLQVMKLLLGVDLKIVRGYPPEYLACPVCDRIWEELHHPTLQLPNNTAVNIPALSLALNRSSASDVNTVVSMNSVNPSLNTSDYGAALTGAVAARKPFGKDRAAGMGSSTGGGDAIQGDGQECRCGVAARLLTTQKEGPNKGRQFYTCAKPQGQQCGYFCWLDEVGNASVGELGRVAAATPRNLRNTKVAVGTGRKDGSSSKTSTGEDPICFHCQQSGHFARQCPRRNIT